MKKEYLLIMALITWFAITGCTTVQTPEPEITFLNINIENNTGYECFYLYLCHVTAASWGNNILGSNILPNGQSVINGITYILNRENRYNFRMIDSNGNIYTKWNVLLTENEIIIFTFDDIDLL